MKTEYVVQRLINTTWVDDWCKPHDTRAKADARQKEKFLWTSRIVKREITTIETVIG